MASNVRATGNLTRIYRILRRADAANPLHGERTYRCGARWSSPGTRITYMAEHLSLAVLEYLAHLDGDRALEDLALIAVDIPPGLPRLSATADHLPANWRQTPAPPELAAVGDNFVREAQAAILVVPSALAPTESNWLINPSHPDFSQFQVQPAEPFDCGVRPIHRSGSSTR